MTTFNHKKNLSILKRSCITSFMWIPAASGQTTENNNRQPSGDLLGKVAMIKTRKNEMVMICNHMLTVDGL